MRETQKGYSYCTPIKWWFVIDLHVVAQEKDALEKEVVRLKSLELELARARAQGMITRLIAATHVHIPHTRTHTRTTTHAHALVTHHRTLLFVPI